MELGIYTFAELAADPATGASVSPHQRMRDLLEEITFAEEVGLDVFAVGEITGLTLRCRLPPSCSARPPR